MDKSPLLPPLPASGRWIWGAALIGALLTLHGCGREYPAARAPAGIATLSGAEGGESAAGAPAEAETAPPEVLPRKIIYTAEVELGSEDLSKTEQRLLALVKSHRGYVAEADTSGAPGTPRTGTWKIRIPVQGFATFMAEVTKIGELRRTHSDSQDVSAEYYDVEARLKNKRVEERRLIQHLERSTARLSDILAVEKELSRVREEIEQMQGRVRFLTNQTELTTVSVSVSEVQDFIPADRAPFGTQIARTFGASLTELGNASRAVTLAAIWLFPWAIVGVLIFGPVVLLFRRFKGSRRPRPAGSPAGE